MKYAEATIEMPEEITMAEIHRVRMPLGLLGFEQMKDFALVTNPAEEPFAWLKVEENSLLTFVVIDPFLIAPDYQPDVPQTDVNFLDLKNADDAQLLCIVTVCGAGQATANLKGPIVVNRHTRIGKQVILANAAEYSVQHPLPLAEEVA